ncbi:hypothetical protein AGDE_13482 [Angomonas deanei]|uniref:Helicase conserved C-terminal domain containing protein, putative n=1 Tax=Angomonas deanei TaxID=59799 RepID=A0A7G2CLI6_9TRYP|nr:hypothetical protein AGDE_13482 [Angomonas deanei]CAD2219927.1 Helicase conserved C-terminal domain containing protein, putative [Angomonas deanei]|eukprot:EPY22302.1 hypothetical protein AGDE_13482 [Angomonas deanei]
MDAIKQAVEGVRPKRPIDYIFISGETPAGQREQLADHFRTDPHCPVAVLSMQSSGTGHNFTCASTVVFAELDWNPSTHLQCEDRVHRIGQSNPCSIKYLLAEGTSDTVIWSLLQTKFSVTNALMESQVRAAEGDFKTIAERSNVARRDVSPVATQSTLDGFIKSQVSQRDKTGSTTPQELSDKTATPTPDEVKQKEEPKIVISLAEMEKRGLRPMQTGMRGPPLPTVTSPIKSDPALKTAAGSVLQMLAKGAGQTKEDDDVVIVHKTPQPKADISPTPIVSLVSSMGAPSGSVPRRRTTFTLGDRSSNTPSVSPVAPVLHSSDSAPAEVVSLDNSPNRLSVHVPFKRRRSGTLIAEEGSAPIPHPPPPVVVPLVESSTVGGPVAHKRTVFKFNTAPAGPSNVTEPSVPASEGKSTPLFQPDFVKPSDASRPARTQFVFKKQ